MATDAHDTAGARTRRHLNARVSAATLKVAQWAWLVDARLRHYAPTLWGQHIKKRLFREAFRHVELIETIAEPRWGADAVRHVFAYNQGGLRMLRQPHWFQTGYFPAFARQYPHIVNRYGIRLTRDRIEIPNVVLLNALLDHVQGLSGDAPAWRFRQVPVDVAIPPDVVGLGIADDGMVSLSVSPEPGAQAVDFWTHDVFVHLLGYLLMPTPTVTATRARFRLLCAARRAVDAAHAAFHATLDREIGAEVQQIDRVSSVIVRNLATFDAGTESTLCAYLFVQGRDTVDLAALLDRQAEAADISWRSRDHAMDGATSPPWTQQDAARATRSLIDLALRGQG